MREADDACLAGAALYIDTDEALAKSGDLLGPLGRGVITAADVRGMLASLSRGQVPGRQGEAERTVFKSVGTELEDLAAAMLACGLSVSRQPSAPRWVAFALTRQHSLAGGRTAGHGRPSEMDAARLTRHGRSRM